MSPKIPQEVGNNDGKKLTSITIYAEKEREE